MLHTVILYVYVNRMKILILLQRFYRRKILRFDISIYDYWVLFEYEKKIFRV